MSLFGQTKSRLSSSQPSSPTSRKPRHPLPLTSDSTHFNEKLFGDSGSGMGGGGSHSRGSSLSGGGGYGIGNGYGGGGHSGRGSIGSGGIGIGTGRGGGMGMGVGLGGVSAVSGPGGWFTILIIPLPRRLFRSRGSPILGNGNASGSNGIGDTFLRGGGYALSSSSTSSSTSSSLSGGSNSTSPPRRNLRLPIPIPATIFNRLLHTHRLRPRSSLLFLILLLSLSIFTFTRYLTRGRNGGRGTNDGWTSWDDDTSLCLTEEELGRIWEWEVGSGHHPSLRSVPDRIPLPPTFNNPVIPQSLLNPFTPSIAGIRSALQNQNQNSDPSSPSPAEETKHRERVMLGSGPGRKYLSLSLKGKGKSGGDNRGRRDQGYPPRPVEGSVADLDRLLERCDFGENKYVRDCLEYLRIGGSLDNGRRYRRTNLTSYQYIYEEEPMLSNSLPDRLDTRQRAKHIMGTGARSNTTTKSSKGKTLSRTPLVLPPPLDVSAGYDKSAPCDPDHPRIFHMFWAGPFTDKPYMAVMSFLFTQNLGLELPPSKWSDSVTGCRPQFWVWINPGPAAAVPNPSAKREMYEQLAVNPWSAPFLHDRFKDVVQFKMWNTTEQLDGIPELANHWRTMPIFNSGGNTYGAPQSQATPPPQPESFADRDIDDQTQTDEERGSSGERTLMDGDGVIIIEKDKDPETGAGSPTPTPAGAKEKSNGIFEIVGSTSESDYDRLSVILSDMARFVLTHRYGGIYLDADTLFLRDWEELWNWRGQFAYRWSWHEKYNTAVLKLHKGSAIGTFLFKTALENGLDFHPMTVSKYLIEADLDRLLFRLPDAMFDPAWLNMERYQRDRPPFPYFPEFEEFFSNNRFSANGPHPLGFDGFFRGAYSYHFHNFWWKPFDPSRNWPDLGSRFLKGEKVLRQAARAAKLASESAPGFETSNIDVRDPSGETFRHRHQNVGSGGTVDMTDVDDAIESDFVDEEDLSWSTVLKRSFEAYLRGEAPNMYGEWLQWGEI